MANDKIKSADRGEALSMSEARKASRGTRKQTTHSTVLHQLSAIGCVSSNGRTRPRLHKRPCPMFGASTIPMNEYANENIRHNLAQTKTSAEPIPTKLEQFQFIKHIEKKQQ
jgi:hypothetical protein